MSTQAVLLTRNASDPTTAIYHVPQLDIRKPRIHDAFLFRKNAVPDSAEQIQTLYDEPISMILTKLLASELVGAVSLIPGGYLVVELNEHHNAVLSTIPSLWPTIDAFLKEECKVAFKRHVEIAVILDEQRIGAS